jgi:hypothetical protein
MPYKGMKAKYDAESLSVVANILLEKNFSAGILYQPIEKCGAPGGIRPTIPGLEIPG